MKSMLIRRQFDDFDVELIVRKFDVDSIIIFLTGQYPFFCSIPDGNKKLK